MQANAAPTQPTRIETVAAQFGALAHHVMSRSNGELLESLDTLGLSLSQVKALGVLEAQGEMSLKHVGEQLGLSLPAVSRSVDGLVKRGFVTREECPDDRRSKLVRLTPDGSATTRELSELRFAGLRAFIDSLSEEEIDVLGSALALLAQRPEIAAHLATGRTC